MDNYFGNPPAEDDIDPFEGMKRAVKCLAGIQELIVVFHVDNISPRIIGCGGDHNLSLFDKLPEDLAHPKFELPALSTLSIEDFESWELKVPSRPVYGWRKCPDADDIMGSPRAYFGDDFDSENDSDGEFLGGIPFPVPLGMGMFLTDDDLDEMDDEDEVEDEDETTDDEMPDLAESTDDEMPGLGGNSGEDENRSDAASLD